MRNILIYSNVPMWAIHHAEAVELSLRHTYDGDRVYFLSCEGGLASCPANPYHKKKLCKKCRLETSWTMSSILMEQVTYLRVPTSEEDDSSTYYFNSMKDLELFSENNVPYGELVISQIVDDLQDSFFSVEEHKNRISNLIKSAKNLYEFSKNIIDERAIEKVYVWNGRRCSDGPVAHAAKNLGIEYETFISAEKRGHYITVPSTRVHDLEFHKKRLKRIVEDMALHTISDLLEQSEKYFNNVRYGVGEHQGHVSFSNNHMKIVTFNEDECKKPKLVIFPSSGWEFASMADYKGFVYSDQYQGILEILTDPKILELWDCHVRWHPNLSSVGRGERLVIEEIIEKTSGSSVHYLPDSQVDSYDLLSKSDVVVTFGSTLGIEAVYNHKPSILLGRAVYEDLDACYVPKSHEELKRILQSVPSPKNPLAAIQFAFYQNNKESNPFEYLKYDGGWSFSYKNVPLSRPKPLIDRWKTSKQKLKDCISIMRNVAR